MYVIHTAPLMNGRMYFIIFTDHYRLLPDGTSGSLCWPGFGHDAYLHHCSGIQESTGGHSSTECWTSLGSSWSECEIFAYHVLLWIGIISFCLVCSLLTSHWYFQAFSGCSLYNKIETMYTETRHLAYWCACIRGLLSVLGTWWT